MIILWLNLRKRGGSRWAAAALERFTNAVNCDLLLLQETVTKAAAFSHELGDLQPVYLSSDLSAFAKPSITGIKVAHTESFLLCVEAHHKVVFNVHLSAYRTSTRQQELQYLEKLIRGEPGDVIVGGDFNLAPRPEDGLFNGAASSWTPPAERQAFRRFTQICGLVDLLGNELEQEYSIERSTVRGQIRFRCDLVLCSARLQSLAKARYLHETRIGAWAISDHSGMVLALHEEATSN
jgi:exonuclease III